MKTFIRWLNEKSNAQAIQGELKRTTQQVIAALKSLLMLDISESSYTSLRNQYEPLIFDGPEGEFARWIKRYVPGFGGQVPQKVKCGQEGCAYFLTNRLVVKATLGKYEVQIAKLMKGDREIVPVIDVFDHSQGVGMILMNRLRTGFSQKLAEDITMAGEMVSEYALFYVNEISQLNLAGFSEYAHSLGMDERRVRISLMVFRIVLSIYEKSGYLIQDLHAGNIGVQTKPGKGGVKTKPRIKDLRVLDTGLPAKWDDERRGFMPAERNP